jgi:DHA2 family multidrug resistance protein
MVFYVNIIPGIVGMLLVLLIIPNTREAVKRSLDLPGLITLTVFLVSLLIALNQGQRRGWDTPYIQWLFVIAGVSFVSFLVIELTRKDPLVELKLYKNLAFTAVSLVLFITAMTFWGTSFLQTFLMQQLLDYTPAQAGYAILPGALAMAVTTLLAGRLVDKVDRRYVVWCGLGMFTLASYWFSFLNLERPMSWMIWMIMARYVTIGFIFTPMNAVSLMVLPPDQVRMGSGLTNLMQQGLGGTLGLAMMTTVLQRRTIYHSSSMAEAQVSASLPWAEVLAPVHDFLLDAGEVGNMVEIKALALLNRHLTQQATVAAYQDCFMLVVVLCIVVAPLVFFLRRR